MRILLSAKIWLLFLNLSIITRCQTENALTHQACVLRSDLEKSLRDNASLFCKIGAYFISVLQICFCFLKLTSLI